MSQANAADTELIQAAKTIIQKLYEPDKHHVGAAIRTKSGRIYTAVHLEAYIGRVAVCAEAIAIGKAISEGDKEFDSIVAVVGRKDGSEPRIVSPCGICRELISDYGPHIEVLLPDLEREYRKVGVMELLPDKYRRE